MVRWFWAASWNLPDGLTSEQALLPFVSSNLAVEPTGVTFNGPIGSASTKTLRGEGWVVAANLQPAAAATLLDPPAVMRDIVQFIISADLTNEVTQAFQCIEDFDKAADAAIAALSRWIIDRVRAPGDRAMRANSLLSLIENNRSITTLREAAQALHVSQRTAQRIAHDYIGMSVGEIIRRSRLQRTLEDIRESPSESLANVAAANGYSDQAHMAAELRATLNQTATQYRAGILEDSH